MSKTATTPATTTDAKAPSLSRLRKWFALEKDRKAAQRKAQDLLKQQHEIEEECTAYVQAAGGETKCVILHGYRLLLEIVHAAVQWKKEFVKRHGQDAAEKLVAAAEKSYDLVIEPPEKEPPA